MIVAGGDVSACMVGEKTPTILTWGDNANGALGKGHTKVRLLLPRVPAHLLLSLPCRVGWLFCCATRAQSPC